MAGRAAQGTGGAEEGTEREEVVAEEEAEVPAKSRRGEPGGCAGSGRGPAERAGRREEPLCEARRVGPGRPPAGSRRPRPRRTDKHSAALPLSRSHGGRPPPSPPAAGTGCGLSRAGARLAGRRPRPVPPPRPPRAPLRAPRPASAAAASPLRTEALLPLAWAASPAPSTAGPLGRPRRGRHAPRRAAAASVRCAGLPPALSHPGAHTGTRRSHFLFLPPAGRAAMCSPGPAAAEGSRGSAAPAGGGRHPLPPPPAAAPLPPRGGAAVVPPLAAPKRRIWGYLLAFGIAVCVLMPLPFPKSRRRRAALQRARCGARLFAPEASEPPREPSPAPPGRSGPGPAGRGRPQPRSAPLPGSRWVPAAAQAPALQHPRGPPEPASDERPTRGFCSLESQISEL